jgi:DNA-directed RNA polymerase specialized sigma24 family protein
MKYAKNHDLAAEYGSSPSEHARAFDDALLSHAEMCYSVALVLTGDPHHAQALARHTLSQAWSLRDAVDAEKSLKQTLLTALREWFLECYCETPHSLNYARTLAKRS